MFVAQSQRAPPRAYQLLLKTHKLTIFLTAHPSATVAKLKDDALSALTSAVLSSSPRAPDDDDMMGDDGDAHVPRVQSTEDFELCRAVKDRGKSSPSSVPYEPLNPSTSIKGLLGNWETLYVQFRDEDGNLLPVEVSQPPLLDDEDDEPRRPPPSLPEPPVAVGKGKRKAPPE